jgi:hypothetical protein
MAEGSMGRKKLNQRELRALLLKLEHDDDAMELISRLVELLAKRSRRRKIHLE